MEVFKSVLNLLETAISGLSDLIRWFINFSVTFGGWSFNFLGFNFEVPSFQINSGVLLTGGFLGAVVVLFIIHLVNVVTG